MVALKKFPAMSQKDYRKKYEKACIKCNNFYYIGFMHTCKCQKYYFCDSCFNNNDYFMYDGSRKYIDDNNKVRLFCDDCDPFVVHLDHRNQDDIMKILGYVLDKYAKMSLDEVLSDYKKNVKPKINKCKQCNCECSCLHHAKNNICGYCCKCVSLDENYNYDNYGDFWYCDTCIGIVSNTLGCTGLNKDTIDGVLKYFDYPKLTPSDDLNDSDDDSNYDSDDY
jgi:hypothetical protein